MGGMSIKKYQLIAGTVLGLVLSLMPTAAIQVNLTMYKDVSVTAAPAKAIGNFGDSTVYNWMQSDVTAYNTAYGTSYSEPTANANGTPLTKVNTPSGGSSITITVPSHEYVFLHWGGKNGGWEQVFYNSGNTVDYTFTAPSLGSGKVGGISFYSIYGSAGGSVPDGGTSILLLGAATSGLFIMRRKG